MEKREKSSREKKSLRDFPMRLCVLKKRKPKGFYFGSIKKALRLWRSGSFPPDN